MDRITDHLNCLIVSLDWNYRASSGVVPVVGDIVETDLGQIFTARDMEAAGVELDRLFRSGQIFKILRKKESSEKPDPVKIKVEPPNCPLQIRRVH